MLRRTRLSILLTLCCCVAWNPPARAANVSGFGSLATNRSDPGLSTDSEYEDPESLNVTNSVRLTPTQIGVSSGDKLLLHLGQAQFGRLRTRATDAGLIFDETDLSTDVSVEMEFVDRITPGNLNPDVVKALRFDVELHGEMTRLDSLSGNGTFATFGFLLRDLDVIATGCMGFAATFSWTSDVRSAASQAGCDGNPDTPRFVPDPGEEPRFTQVTTPGPPRYTFGTRGYLEIPTDDFEDFEGWVLGTPFGLRVFAAAQATCGVEPCASVSDFIAAVIDNARFVDANGDPVASASFTTESGYDYVTATVPEADPFAMGLVALGAIGFGLGSRNGRRRAEAG